MPWPMLTYRGYYTRGKRDRRECVYLVKFGNFFLPRSFSWMEPENIEGLKSYIDALCTRNIGASAPWEDRGVAVDLVHQPAPEDVPMVWVSPERLLAVLRGEDPLQIPANAQVRITSHSTGNGRQLPVELQAEVLANEGPLFDRYVALIRQHVGSDKPLFYIETPPTKLRKGLVPYLGSTGANLPANDGILEHDEPSVTPKPIPTAPPRSIAEEPYATTAHNGYEEIISHVRNVERPYFVRRLVRQQSVFWAGTAWLAAGPWVVYHEDKTIADALALVGEEVA